MKNPMSRRQALTALAGTTAAISAASTSLRAFAADPTATTAPAKLKGHINHSVCKWCYGKIPLDEFCAAAKGMGITSIDLIAPPDFPTLKKHGLICAMVSNPTVDGLGGIGKAWNRVEHHDKLVQAYEQWIPQVAAAGFKNLICFSGNRAGLDDEKGIENCALGLKRIMPAAEKAKVVIVMELLNSKIDHKDYQCDHTNWGVALCKRVGSEHFKLLYDIYHMQIMEGDVIRTIKGDKGKGIESAAPYIAHYHTGGVPGRNEIDTTQELYYPAIMEAIVSTGYQGYVAQEFIPRRTPLVSLQESIAICDV
jgi:hydroxypyruvate isomerase